MNQLPYKLSSDYRELKTLLDNRNKIVCFFNGKICIGKRRYRRYVFYTDELCYCDFSNNCSDMTFIEAIAEHKVKFILPSDIANIFNIHFKVKIHNQKELKKVVEHLTEAGFNELKNDFRNPHDVYGITVGRAKFIILNDKTFFSASLNSELSVKEVLKMKFK